MNQPEAPRNPRPRLDPRPPQKRFESTLPLQPTEEVKPDALDLEVGDIQTRLPFGSEDIADK